MRLGWNRDECGVITVYAHTKDGKFADVADFWLKPLVDRFGMGRVEAKELQQKLAETLVTHYYDSARQEWECPIKHQGCKSNCGSYGCGN